MNHPTCHNKAGGRAGQLFGSQFLISIEKTPPESAESHGRKLCILTPVEPSRHICEAVQCRQEEGSIRVEIRCLQCLPFLSSASLSFFLLINFNPLNMDNSSKSEIPSISTKDFSSTPVINVNDHERFAFPTLSTSSISHSRYPSDLSSLSPGPPRTFARVMDTSIDEDGSSAKPPTPTLSTLSSVNCETSTALRDNEPADRSAFPAHICPRDPSRSRCRRSSTATGTSIDDGTVVDRSPVIPCLYPATSDTTTSTRSTVETLNSLTPTHVGNSKGLARDHREPGRKVSSGAQGATEAEGDDGGIVKVRDEPSLFFKLRDGRFVSSSFVLKSRESMISKRDRIAL